MNVHSVPTLDPQDAGWSWDQLKAIEQRCREMRSEWINAALTDADAAALAISWLDDGATQLLVNLLLDCKADAPANDWHASIRYYAMRRSIIDMLSNLADEAVDERDAAADLRARGEL